MMIRTKNRSWFSQWNYFFFIDIFNKWKKENKKQIKKIVNIICWLFIIIFLIVFCNNEFKKVFASYQSYVNEKQRKEAYYEEQQMIRELKLKEKIEKDLQDKEYQEKQKRIKQAKQFEADKKEFNKYLNSYIEITWWENTGPTPPYGNSKVGKVKKIVGLNAYGTWGSQPITYKKTVFKTIMHKEYIEIRTKENENNIRKNTKRKFRSWGLHPSTS